MVVGYKQYDGHKFDVKGGYKDRPAKLVVERGPTITVKAKLEKSQPARNLTQIDALPFDPHSQISNAPKFVARVAPLS